MTVICDTQASPSNPTLLAKLTEAGKKFRQWIIAHISQRRRYSNNRNSFAQLLALDNHILDDLGISRGEVRWANNLPLHINAARELEKIRALSRMSSHSPNILL